MGKLFEDRIKYHRGTETGIITVVNSDGTYSVNIGGRDFDVPNVSSSEGRKYQVGDPVLLDMANRNDISIITNSVYK